MKKVKEISNLLYFTTWNVLIAQNHNVFVNKMSSSLASSNQTVPVSTMAGSNSVLPSLIGSRSIPPAAAAVSLHPQMAAQFREIHKNTWLKRLTAEGKKICVGPKVSSFISTIRQPWG